MSTFNRLSVAILVVLYFYYLETNAIKHWGKDDVLDAKTPITSRFNRETLTDFLRGTPELWEVGILKDKNEMM